MTQPLQTCPHCGANLTLDDLRGTDCPYCHTALPHHARAAEHAALVNQMLHQQGVHHVNVPYQYGAAPPAPQIPAVYAQAMEHTNKAIKGSLILTFVIVGAVFVMIAVMGIAFMLFFYVSV